MQTSSCAAGCGGTSRRSRCACREAEGGGVAGRSACAACMCEQEQRARARWAALNLSPPAPPCTLTWQDDDREIQAEGLDTLTEDELRAACRCAHVWVFWGGSLACCSALTQLLPHPPPLLRPAQGARHACPLWRGVCRLYARAAGRVAGLVAQQARSGGGGEGGVLQTHWSRPPPTPQPPTPTHTPGLSPPPCCCCRARSR